MLRTFATALFVAAVFAAVATPFVRRLALRLGAISTPGGRHIHDRAIPRLGGIAIMAAFVVTIAAVWFFDANVMGVFSHNRRHLAGLFAGGIIMGAVGFVDDRRQVPALHKLYAQILVATIAYAAGFRIEAVQLPLIGPLSMGVFALPVTIAWIVGIINAVNLIDGLDGLAAGVVFFACFTNLVVAQLAGSFFVAIIMATMMGAVLGFLFYNFNPARIFMGDSGSYFLGYVLAASSLAGPKASTPVALLVPIIALGVPIFDVLLAMVRRVLERRSIFSPDRGHIHHRLLDMGITHRRAVLILYGVSIVFAFSAIAIYFGRSWQVGGALLTASLGLVGLVRSAGYFQHLQSSRRKLGHSYSEDVDLFRRAVPDLQLRLVSAASTAEVFAALDGFCVRAKLHAYALIETSSNVVVQAWQADVVEKDRRDVSAQFTLDRDGIRALELSFRWPSESGEVSPQSEVLLQIVVDLVETRLQMLRGGAVERSPAVQDRVSTSTIDAKFA